VTTEVVQPDRKSVGAAGNGRGLQRSGLGGERLHRTRFPMDGSKGSRTAPRRSRYIQLRRLCERRGCRARDLLGIRPGAALGELCLRGSAPGSASLAN
jgi:hypothetical protein